MLFFFFLIIDFYFLISAAIAQIFDPIAELKKAKSEIERHPVIVEAKKESFQCNLELHKPFCAFYSSIHFALGNNFLFHLYA